MSRSPWDLGVIKRDAEQVSMVGFPTGQTSPGVLPYGINTTSIAGLSTVWRCLDVLGTGVSQLPWSEHRGTLDLPLSRLTRRPSDFYTRREWVQLVVRTMALYDVCYLLKLEPYDSEGVPLGLWPVPPQIIVPRVIDTYNLLPPTSYQIGHTTVSAENIIPVRRGPMPGIPDYLSGVMQLARATFAASLAAENYASRFWQAGGSPTTVLTTDANLSDTQATQLGNRWSQRRSQGPDHPAILANGLKAAPWGADPTTESAVEARRQEDVAIVRYFGVPARMANVPSLDSQTYKTSQEENLDLLHYTFANYIGAIEDVFTDLLPGNREMSMDPTRLTEGTQLSRAQAWQLALGTGGGPGWIMPEEVREKEGLPPQEMRPSGPDDDSQKELTPGTGSGGAAEVTSLTGGRK